MPSPKLPGFERIEVELSLPHAAVGVLNITGPLQSWSWAETLPHTMLPVSLLLQVVHTLHLHASLAACVGVCSCSSATWGVLVHAPLLLLLCSCAAIVGLLIVLLQASVFYQRSAFSKNLQPFCMPEHELLLL